MQYIQDLYFLQNYSLPTLIISVVTAVVMIVLYKFFCDKLNATVFSFLPFAISLLLNVVYTLIFELENGFSVTNVLSAGLLCGSVSCVITGFVKSIINGRKTELNKVDLVIEEVLGAHLIPKTKSIAILTIKSDIVNQLTQGAPDDEIAHLVLLSLQKYAVEGKTQAELLSLATLTVNAVKQLIKN